MEDNAWHYLCGTESTRLPRRHVFLDTEARDTRVAGRITQTWRCGVACYRNAPKKGKATETTRAYTELSALWDDIDAWVRPRSRVVLWAHNLSYDTRVASVFREMGRRGWRLTGWNIAPQGTWLVWRADGRTLTMVDSASVYPTTVAQLAKYFQLDHIPLPSNVDSMDRWLARCARDVQILRDSIVAYLNWLDREDLGPWQLTGTGQSFAAFRHRFLTHKMLVHWDDDVRRMERRAMWAGRCEAYWHGTAHHTQAHEWDLSAAYPRIALHDNVPTQLLTPHARESELWAALEREDRDVLATVEITTKDPLVPAEHDGRILWPVGQFGTTLWGPEIRLARDHGAEITIIDGHVYHAEPALQAWAQWVLSIVDSGDPEVTAWQRLLAQHWSRALIGRLAMQHTEWEELADMPTYGIQWWNQVDTDTGETSELVHIGQSLWQSTGMTDWASSIPAITGWITSRCREIMTRLWLATPDRSVLYMDTDSLIMRADSHAHAPVELAASMGHHLRLKRAWDRITINGPRQIITGDRVRVSGVPVRATRMADGSLRGEVWESLRGALRAGRSSQVRITPRTWRLRAVDARRTVGADGWTEPVRIGPVTVS